MNKPYVMGGCVQKTHESLVTFFDWIQEQKKGVAPLKIYQTNKRVNRIYRGHEDND